MLKILKILKLWKGIIILIPIPFFIIFTNLIADAGNIFHDETSRQVAAQIAKGNAVYSVGHFDERNVKFNLIQFMPEKVECLVFGPSLSMGIRSHDVGTDSFYNLGESGADFYDIMAQFGALEAYKKEFNRIIFCVDFDFFNEQYIIQNTKNKKYKPFSQYMIDILEHKKVDAPKIRISIADSITHLKGLLSVAYFQSSARLLLTNINDYFVKKEKSKRFGIPDKNYTEAYYQKDASWVYAKSFQEHDLKFVLEDIKKYPMVPHLVKKEHLRKESVFIFEKLISYLQGKGVDIKLYLCPLPPTLWDRIDLKDYFMIDELEEYARKIAEKYDLKIIGSYNPHNLGVSDEDFYDARHIRHEKLSVYLDFK